MQTLVWMWQLGQGTAWPNDEKTSRNQITIHLQNSSLLSFYNSEW